MKTRRGEKKPVGFPFLILIQIAISLLFWWLNRREKRGDKGEEPEQQQQLADAAHAVLVDLETRSGVRWKASYEKVMKEAKLARRPKILRAFFDNGENE